MKKILPMGVPIVKCYSKHAHIFSILGAQTSQYLVWVYNYYVQLYFPEEHREFIADYLIPSIFTYAPNLFVSRIERTVAYDIKGGIIEFLKDYIDKGYYIYTLLDVSKIATYHCESFHKHDPLIYGYDDEKMEFYFADIYQKGKYETGIASYDEIVDAFGAEQQWKNWNASEWVLDVVCMKYKDLDVRFQFDKEMYVELLTNYIEKENSYSKHWGVQGWEKGITPKKRYGIDIYSFVREYIEKERMDRRGLDVRGFYVIMEHKMILEKTIEYLLGDSWKKNYVLLCDLLQLEINEVSYMLNACLKYNATGIVTFLDKIREYTLLLEENERKLVPELIDIIRKEV